MPVYNTFTDNELIAFIKEGHETAFAELYRRYKGCLYLHAYRMLQDKDEAMDIVQEFFATIWAKRDTLIITTTVNSYLYSAIRNRILNFIAHQKVVAGYTNSLEDYLEAGSPASDEKFLEKELISLIENEVALLPPKMRQCLS
ncbi:RNA polymerase sigma factor [Mucilaginibacter humi]|uniref:RNA polymerase sigma factor n=1 Tax=Mucilaginibacter humi TaxID=2732510 RepID=UPI00293B9B4A|nr:sigma factor [Mucilaginibacter humi]